MYAVDADEENIRNMVFDREPEDWIELQMFVGRLFRECGFNTEISKVVELVRGKKEIDVYAQDVESEYESEILIECKFWNKPINQEVVHSFRTVVNDYGATSGFIVSKVGFQKGCIDAVNKTNIKLVTLKNLENRYFERWKKNLARKYRRYADPLFPYWDFPGKRVADGGEIDSSKRNLIYQAYRPICELGPGDDFDSTFTKKFPITLPIINDNIEAVGYLTITTYREFFDYIDENKEKALKHYKILYREVY